MELPVPAGLFLLASHGASCPCRLISASFLWSFLSLKASFCFLLMELFSLQAYFCFFPMERFSLQAYFCFLPMELLIPAGFFLLPSHGASFPCRLPSASFPWSFFSLQAFICFLAMELLFPAGFFLLLFHGASFPCRLPSASFPWSFFSLQAFICFLAMELNFPLHAYFSLLPMELPVPAGLFLLPSHGASFLCRLLSAFLPWSFLSLQASFCFFSMELFFPSGFYLLPCHGASLSPACFFLLPAHGASFLCRLLSAFFPWSFFSLQAYFCFFSMELLFPAGFFLLPCLQRLSPPASLPPGFNTAPHADAKSGCSPSHPISAISLLCTLVSTLNREL